MPEPLKNIYHEPFLRQFALLVQSRFSVFDTEQFVNMVLGSGWDELELKRRMRRITESLGATLPAEYDQALDVLESIAGQCRGFAYMFFPDFVERYGLGHWERSVAALETFTPMSSSEFAVRPFLLRDQERMMAQMREWSSHADEHVRRLASEGCRPRLPWAVALPALKRDPTPIWPILEKLQSDPSEYVRRSAANHLHDISKDHPDLAAEWVRTWHGKDTRTDWVLRHGSRGLIRAVHPGVMAQFGLLPVSGVKVEEWSVSPAVVDSGGSVEVRYAIRLPAGVPVKLRLELAVTFPRHGRKAYRKQFKLTEKVVPAGDRVEGSRRHSFADLSTRRHYPGIHRMALMINGHEAASAEAVLQS